jgi:hypothetical protein
MVDSDKNFTHTVWGYHRTGKNRGVLLECGKGRIDEKGVAHQYMDRTPRNFTGYTQLVLNGEKPQLPPVKPQRPGETDNADDTNE